MVVMALAEILEDAGYPVCAIAATEDDAVAAASRCKPGMIIADEHLRAGTGAAAVERILLSGPVPCVFISGAPRHPDRHGADVLQKPFLIGDLVRAIRAAVGEADDGGIHVGGDVCPGPLTAPFDHWPLASTIGRESEKSAR